MTKLNDLNGYFPNKKITKWYNKIDVWRGRERKDEFVLNCKTERNKAWEGYNNNKIFNIGSYIY